MIKTKSLLILISTLLFSNYYLSSFTQELTITTYYPSPVGIYKELRAKKMAIGEDYYNPSDYSWGSEISSDADLVVEGKVGIGVLKPEKELHVAGDAKIENDLNVDGDTQLGNESSDKTTVKGDLNVDGGVAVGGVTNMGPGTINAEKIYVDGSEIGGGGFSDCEVVEKECCVSYATLKLSCDVSCPSDKWLVGGGGHCDDTYESYPKIPGKGGTWHLYGEAYSGPVFPSSCIKVYAICCK